MFQASVILVLFLITVVLCVGVLFTIHYHRTLIQENVESGTVIMNSCEICDEMNIDSDYKFFAKHHQDCSKQTQKGIY